MINKKYNMIKNIQYSYSKTDFENKKKDFDKINKNIIKNLLFYKNLSFNLKIDIKNKLTYFNSSSSSIIKNPYKDDTYVINTRIVNYKLDIVGRSNIGTNNCITINKISTLDKFFNEINMKYLYPENYDIKYVGVEDIRLFNFNCEIYFIGSYYNPINCKVQIVSNKYIFGETYKPIIINPTFKTSFNWE